MATKQTPKRKVDRRAVKDRFYLLPEATVNLIKAEEEYLREGGWLCVAIHGLWSEWSNPHYVATYSRTHALLLAKAEDQNVGIA